MTVWLHTLKSTTPGGTAKLLSTWRTWDVSGAFTGTALVLPPFSFFIGFATTVSPSVTYRAWLSMAGLPEDCLIVASELNSSGSSLRRLVASLIPAGCSPTSMVSMIWPRTPERLAAWSNRNNSPISCFPMATGWNYKWKSQSSHTHRRY